MKTITLQPFSFNKKNIESEKRVKDLYHVKRGKRDRIVHPRYIYHTYSIKNGLSYCDLMIENITANNILLNRLKMVK